MTTTERDSTMEACECSEGDGPCGGHSDVLAQREGAAVRTADELCAVFVGDVAAYLADAGIDPDAGMLAAMADADAYWTVCPSGGWAPVEDPDAYSLSEALADAVRFAEQALPSGVCVWWEDGYVISRITGGPLLDEDGDR